LTPTGSGKITVHFCGGRDNGFTGLPELWNMPNKRLSDKLCTCHQSGCWRKVQLRDVYNKRGVEPLPSGGVVPPAKTKAQYEGNQKSGGEPKGRGGMDLLLLIFIEVDTNIQSAAEVQGTHLKGTQGSTT